ncbi:MAG: glucoamylase [Blastocatellia bacterium]
MKAKFLPCCLVFFLAASVAAQAPGAPGGDAVWLTAAKEGVGTTASLKSKVWLTLARGVLTEIYYPNVTTANVQMLQFFVFDPARGKVETEFDDAIVKTESLPLQPKAKKPVSLTFRQRTTSRDGRWEIEKIYVLDPGSDSVLFTVSFRHQNPNTELFVYFDPSINNTGMHDTATASSKSLIAYEGDAAAALRCGNCRMDLASAAFSGVNDALTQLRRNGKQTETFDRAENGNVVLTARVSPANARAEDPLLFALSFGRTPSEAEETGQSALEKGFERIRLDYETEWGQYLDSLPATERRYRAQFLMAAMVLKAFEDKAVRGGNVASLSIPWGGGLNANEDVGGGYHLIWARDLYHVFTAFLAIGDRPAAERALNFLLEIQQKSDGSFPQNSWLDGRPGWGSLQMDEVGYPLVMAWQISRFDHKTYRKHIKPAADFIVRNGPATPQERWEEESGYSPSTIAAEIAGLVCAADIAKRNGDFQSAANYLKTADDWESKIEKWTATTTGKYGDGNYYLRITQNGRPDAGDPIGLKNGSGTYDEREIVDAGFLELVRLGIRRPDDPLIVKSLKIIDQLIRAETPNGPGYYRYLHDGYGEMDDGRRWNWDGTYRGKGRLWALLSGERGEYEIALSNSLDRRGGSRQLAAARSRLDHMLGFSSDTFMLPEQVWDKRSLPVRIDRLFLPDLQWGKGTGSATPLAWSMAQFLRLATNIAAGRNLETPAVVYRRYAGRPGKN